MGGRRILALRAHLLYLLQDILKSSKENLENAHELATIYEVYFRNGLGFEDAGEEADGHVVIAHLVQLLPRHHLLLEEDEQMEDDSSIKFG